MSSVTRTPLALGILGLAAFCSSALGSTDLNRDGVTNGADLAILVENWGPCAAAVCPMDLNADREVDAADVAILLESWGVGDDTDTGVDLIASAVREAIGTGSGAAAPGEWCSTHQHYVTGLINRGEGGVAAACLDFGPCDDAGNRNAAIPNSGTPIKTYRLSIHVFCENNGGNCAATTADVIAAVNAINANYAQWNIQFVYESNFINKTQYRYLAPYEEVGMKNAYANSPDTKLNIYVVATSGGSWGTFPWDPDALGKQGGIVMTEGAFAAGVVNGFVITHEIGHCLGLWHVFHGADEVPACSDCYEAATVPPSGSDLTGDRCSDTFATSKNEGQCHDPTTLDPCSGNPWVETPYLNFMSYAYSCTIKFTPQQAGRMHCWSADLLSGWLVLPAPPAVPGAPTLTKLAGLQVKVVWADNSNNETGFRVQREKKSGPAWIETQIVATVGADITTVTDSPTAGTFHYRVQSYNGNGDSAWSAWTQIKN